jgi:hypothetical protein
MSVACADPAMTTISAVLLRASNSATSHSRWRSSREFTNNHFAPLESRASIEASLKEPGESATYASSHHAYSVSVYARMGLEVRDGDGHVDV